MGCLGCSSVEGLAGGVGQADVAQVVAVVEESLDAAERVDVHSQIADAGGGEHGGQVADGVVHAVLGRPLGAAGEEPLGAVEVLAEVGQGVADGVVAVGLAGGGSHVGGVGVGVGHVSTWGCR